MTDPRYAKLSDLLVKYSTGLKKNERILLEMIDVPDEFTIELMRAARAGRRHSPGRDAPHPRHPRNHAAQTTIPMPPWCARWSCSA